MAKPNDLNEPMRYGMLGMDDTSPVEKLAKYTGEVDWAYLKSHFDAGVLIYVDPSLALPEVGLAFSKDDSQAVEAWFKKEDLVRPGEPHAAYWEESAAVFTALVVSPFVLIQPFP